VNFLRGAPSLDPHSLPCSSSSRFSSSSRRGGASRPATRSAQAALTRFALRARRRTRELWALASSARIRGRRRPRRAPTVAVCGGHHGIHRGRTSKSHAIVEAAPLLGTPLPECARGYNLWRNFTVAFCVRVGRAPCLAPAVDQGVGARRKRGED
jgi:hypothetical protein